MELKRLAWRVMRAEGEGQCVVRVVFVGPTRMAQLNLKYRGAHGATDVLSFSAHGEHTYLGEVLLCRSYLRRQARANCVPYEEELSRMTIHGVLHLLGYDHERASDARVMFVKQEQYLKKFV